MNVLYMADFSMNMKTRLFYMWEIIRASFWFLPLLIILMAIAAALTLIYVDTVYHEELSERLFMIFSGTAQSARSVLSVIAGAMLGVAGTVFSITLVALTLASSQFGPRLLRNFMYNRINQVVLGVYVATFVYCIIVLHSVKSVADELILSLSITFALVLATGSIFLLIIFIHHISVSIQADHIIADVDNKLKTSLKVLFPANVGDEPSDQFSTTDLHNIQKKYPIKDEVILERSGYIQALDREGLMEIAVDKDLFMEINHRPGEFLLEHMPLVVIRSAEKCREVDKKQIRKAFIIGPIRTPSQDAEFSIHQIVEVAARALSPGINDPFTAIRCVDSLAANINLLVNYDFPSPYRYDENKQLRIVAKPEKFSGILDAAFNQIRQFSKNSPAVIIRLMEVLVALNGRTHKKEHQLEIKRHAYMILKAAQQNLAEENDLADLKERFNEL
jgi:uncharacterized membrane protein